MRVRVVIRSSTGTALTASTHTLDEIKEADQLIWSLIKEDRVYEVSIKNADGLLAVYTKERA